MKGEEKVRQGEWRRKGEKEGETEVGGGREGEAGSEGTRMKGQETGRPSPQVLRAFTRDQWDLHSSQWLCQEGTVIRFTKEETEAPSGAHPIEQSQERLCSLQSGFPR